MEKKLWKTFLFVENFFDQVNLQKLFSAVESFHHCGKVLQLRKSFLIVQMFLDYGKVP